MLVFMRAGVRADGEWGATGSLGTFCCFLLFFFVRVEDRNLISVVTVKNEK